jgi:hypothetical protein
VLEENDALAAEAACKEDEDGAGGEGLAGPGGVDGLADLEWGWKLVEGCFGGFEVG